MPKHGCASHETAQEPPEPGKEALQEASDAQEQTADGSQQSRQDAHRDVPTKPLLIPCKYPASPARSRTTVE